MTRLTTICAALLFCSVALAQTAFEQVGLFESTGGGDRVYLMRVPSGSDPDTVRTLAETLPHTAGELTTVFIYEGVRPDDVVTGMPDFFSAFDAVYGLASDTAFRWRYDFVEPGSVDQPWHDCNVTPDHRFCDW